MRMPQELFAQDDLEERRVTNSVIGALQEVGSMKATDLLNLKDSLNCADDVFVRVVRILTATPLVNEVILEGDDVRGDRVFNFGYGVALGQRVNLDLILDLIELRKKESEACQERLKRIKSLKLSPGQPLTEEMLDGIARDHSAYIEANAPIYQKLCAKFNLKFPQDENKKETETDDSPGDAKSQASKQQDKEEEEEEEKEEKEKKMEKQRKINNQNKQNPQLLQSLSQTNK